MKYCIETFMQVDLLVGLHRGGVTIISTSAARLPQIRQQARIETIGATEFEGKKITNHLKAQSPAVVFRNFTVNDGLSHNFGRGFLQDSRGFIWIATIDGLNKFDGYTFKVYKAKHNDTTSLSSNNISDALVEDADGNIWIGTWGAHDPGDPSSLSHNSVHCITEDKEGKLWIGTLGGALNKFDLKPSSLFATGMRKVIMRVSPMMSSTMYSATVRTGDG